MTTFFTADYHLGHKKVIEYSGRPFSSVREMDSAIIDRHNSVVSDDDKVYLVGDFTLNDGKDAVKYIQRLKGILHFMPGSHDRWMTEDWINHIDIYSASGKKILILPAQVELVFPKEMNPDGDKHELIVVLNHYSMRSWNMSHYGSLHFYGHHHCRLPGHGRSMDIGVDCHTFTPQRLESLVSVLSKKPIIGKSGDKENDVQN